MAFKHHLVDLDFIRNKCRNLRMDLEQMIARPAIRTPDNLRVMDHDAQLIDKHCEQIERDDEGEFVTLSQSQAESLSDVIEWARRQGYYMLSDRAYKDDASALRKPRATEAQAGR